MTKQFEHLGYAKDYFMGAKYIGTERCEWQEGKPTGYDSRQDHVAVVRMKVGRKTIPAEARYWAIVNPLCGKALKA